MRPLKLPFAALVWQCLQACEKALTKVQGHQRVSCVPGIASLARKNRLIATLVQHYGEGAFELTPRSWLLPNQYWQWRVQAEAQVTETPELHVVDQYCNGKCKLKHRCEQISLVLLVS